MVSIQGIAADARGGCGDTNGALQEIYLGRNGAVRLKGDKSHLLA
jgi:hypothetical protein